MIKWLLLGALLFFAGCVSNAQDVIARDCNTLDKNLRDQCYFEKSLYQSLLGDYSGAMASCEQLKPSFASSVIDFFLTGSKRSLYNRCVENVALSSGDAGFCDNTLEESAATALFGILSYDSQDQCEARVQSQAHQDVRLSTLLQDIFS